MNENINLFEKIDEKLYEKNKLDICDGNDEISGLPKCFDWRNVSNINYDSKVSHQGKLFCLQNININ